MKNRLLIGAAALQVLVLAYMAGEREWVLNTGRTVFLRTAPVDPRDVMRGDYVRLSYEITSVTKEYWRDGLLSTNRAQPALRRDATVYAALRVDDQDIAQLVALSDRPPASGPYIRGRVEHAEGWAVNVRYGVEAFFLEQGKGLELERGRTVENVRVPLEMEVAVGRNGLAVLKGQRWAPLGLGLDLVTRQVQTTNRLAASIVVGAKLRLVNTDTNREVAVVMPPEGNTFALVPDLRWAGNSWRQVTHAAPPFAPKPSDVVLLKPGESRALQVSLEDPVWRVVNLADPLPTPKPVWEAGEQWSTRFRFEYRSPGREACRGLPHADRIWHGRLTSRSFNATGAVD